MPSIRGFTLLELLIVITIFAGASTLVGVNLVGRDSANLESIARTLMTDLRYVRSRALVGNIDTAISFDVANNTYTSRAAKIERSLPEALDMKLTVDRRDIDAQRGTILFYPDGSSSGGEIRLSRNGRVMQVTTSWLNGHVELR